MFRARAALSVLAPAGQQNFGSWLIRQQKSQVRVNEFELAKTFFNTITKTILADGSWVSRRFGCQIIQLGSSWAFLERLEWSLCGRNVQFMASRADIGACSEFFTYTWEMFNFSSIFLPSYFQSWDAYFRNNSYQAPPSLALPLRNHVPLGNASLPSIGGGGAALTGGRVDDKLIDDHLAVQAIIRSYQVNTTRQCGHFVV